MQAPDNSSDNLYGYRKVHPAGLIPPVYHISTDFSTGENLSFRAQDVHKQKGEAGRWYAYPPLPPIAVHKWFASARVYTHKPRYFQSECPKEKEIALIHV